MLAAGSFTALGRPEGLVALAKFHMELLAPENEVVGQWATLAIS